MAKAKGSSAKQRSGPETNSEAHPTQSAFEPASKEHFWAGLAIGLICLVGAGFGLGAWLDPSIAASLDSADRPGQSLAGWLPFVFPVFVPIALYFFWSTGRQWWETRAFERHKQTTSGVITGLWIDRSAGQGKQHYAGYRFGDRYEAYQKVQSRTYNNLTVGETVMVEYVPHNPRLSRVDWQKRRQKPSASPTSRGDGRV